MAIARLGDWGTVFRFTLKDQDGVAVDVSGASAKSVIFKAPDGTSTTQSASFTTDGTDGVIEYTTADGDIGAAGAWEVLGSATLASGKWTTIDAIKLEVR